MSKRSLISGRGHSRNYDNCDGKNVCRNLKFGEYFEEDKINIGLNEFNV